MKPVQETNKIIAEHDPLMKWWDGNERHRPAFKRYFQRLEDPEPLHVSTHSIDKLKYHSSIEWLYPVAKKVKEELEDVLTKNRNDDEALDCYIKLEDAATTFELYLLYEVVCNVIEFLNKHKEG